MNDYKRYVCSNCINDNCIEKITTTQINNVTIIKCENYIKPKSNTDIYLTKYINELKLRKIKYDC